MPKFVYKYFLSLTTQNKCDKKEQFTMTYIKPSNNVKSCDGIRSDAFVFCIVGYHHGSMNKQMKHLILFSKACLTCTNVVKKIT